MNITLAAIGRLKDGPDKELFERYWKRFAATGRGVGLMRPELIELPESRAADVDTRKADEAERLLASGAKGAALIALDETGKAMTSAQFATFVAGQRDGGCKSLIFAIGGPDGHGDAVRAAALRTVSLGAMTLPHGLARIVLAEQLYRAATILAGHPYHRV